MVGQLANADPKIAERVAAGLGLQGKIEPVPTTVKVRTDLKPSPSLSILAKAKQTLEGRKIGVLIADGTDTGLVQALTAAAKAEKANIEFVAPKVGGAVGSDGKVIEADLQLAGGPSVLFDAVFVAISSTGAATLMKEAAAVAWVHDAYSHCKVIGATEGAQALLDVAGAMKDEGVLVGGGVDAFIATASKGRVWSREPKVRTIY